MVSEGTEPDQPAGVVDHVQNRRFPAGQHVKFERNCSEKERKEKKTQQDHAAVLSLGHETLFFFSTCNRGKVQNQFPDEIGPCEHFEQV